jgi:hypothetical protein
LPKGGVIAGLESADSLTPLPLQKKGAACLLRPHFSATAFIVSAELIKSNALNRGWPFVVG